MIVLKPQHQVWQQKTRSQARGQACRPGARPVREVMLRRLIVPLILLTLGMAGLAPGQMIRLRSTEFDPMKSPRLATGSLSPQGGQAALPSSERRLVLVQFTAPASAEQLESLAAQDIRLIGPIPDFAYLATAPSTMDLAGMNRIYVGMAATGGGAAKAPRWIGAFDASWKLNPKVSARINPLYQAGLAPADGAVTTDTVASYNIQIAKTGGEANVRATLKRLCRSARLHSKWESFEVWTVDADNAAIKTLMMLNSVVWIEPYVAPKLNCERAALSVAGSMSADGSAATGPGTYAAWLNKVGLSGEGVTVQVIDDGLSKGDDSNKPGSAHPDFVGRIAGIDNLTEDPLGDGGAGHGHINAGIIMGQPKANGGMKDSKGFLLGQGVAPNAKIYATKVFSNDGPWDAWRTYDSAVKPAYGAGARISSNSWGSAVYGEYVSDCYDFDRLTRDADNAHEGQQQMLFVFAAGNEGESSDQTIGAPASAKNVISVGAAENSDKGERDGTSFDALDADSMRDVAIFSSRGPTADMRLAPTLMAPGTHVAGAASDSPNFDGMGVAGRFYLAPGEYPEALKYYPAYQKYYTWSSGTSHACPVVSGAAALFHEYYKKKYGKLPSPAMVKAALVAGAVDMAGGNNTGRTDDDGNTLKVGHIPNINTGWGRVSLTSIAGVKHNEYAYDQGTTFLASGQTFKKTLYVTDQTKPLKIVLAWTDAAGMMSSGKTLVNDLDLTVSDGNKTWLGNVFSGGQSVTGGKADALNNLECVFIKTPEPALYTITVTAHALVWDAIANTTGLKQDFALFVTNGDAQSSIGQVTLDRESYKPTDSVRVTLCDYDLRGKGTVQVTLTSQPTGDSEKVTLNEIGTGVGIFKKVIALSTSGSPVANNGKLSAHHGDTVTATYQDATLNASGKAYTSTDTARVDGLVPRVINPSVVDLDFQSGRLTFTSSEAAQATVTFGSAFGESDRVLTDMDFGTEHTFLFDNLSPCTPYFYMIQLTDKAGNTATDHNGGQWYAFQTLAQKDLFKDTIEPTAKTGWSHSAAQGVDDWSVVEIPSYLGPRFFYGHAWFINDTIGVKDASLVTPAVKLSTHSWLTFVHTYQFDANYFYVRPRNIGFDGGVIEISTDDGVHWSDLGGYIRSLESGYNSFISIGTGNPLSGRMAWSGGDLSTSKETVTVDLSAFANQTVRVRFRCGCDDSRGGGGWYIKNVQFYDSAVGCIGDLAQLTFDGQGLNCGTTNLHFTLIDKTLSQSGSTYPSDFRLATTQVPVGIPTVPTTLSMVDPVGVWEGDLAVKKGSQPKSVKIGGLEIKEGEWMQLIYHDPRVNGTPQTIRAQLTLDCTAATMTDREETYISDTEAYINIKSSQPAKVTVTYGLGAGSLNKSLSSVGFASANTLHLTGLAPNSTYYYQVELLDEGGNVSKYTNAGYYFKFETGTRVPEKNTFENSSDADGWTTSSATTESNNTWSLIASSYAHSPSLCWFGKCATNRKDDSLVMPPVDIVSGTLLRFWHTFNFQSEFDGGVIEISTDDGKTWKDLGPNILDGFYTMCISPSQGSPIAGRQAWTGGGLGPMSQVVVDLSPYQGQGRLIRFRLACDLTKSQKGWFIDDVTLDTVTRDGSDLPGAPTLLTPSDGASVPFDQPLTLTWKSDASAKSYKFFVGTSPITLAQVGPALTATTIRLPDEMLKAGMTYYWRVVAVNDDIEQPSALRTFKTKTVATMKLAQQVVGENVLSESEKAAVDTNNDGRIDVTDIIRNVQQQYETPEPVGPYE